MFSEREIQAFRIIDEFLYKLKNSHKGEFLPTFNKPAEFRLAKEIMLENKLIVDRNPGSNLSVSEITQEGLFVIASGGVEKFLLNKRNSRDEMAKLELQQLRINVELLEKQYNTYQRDRQRFIRNEVALWIGLGISIISLIVSLFVRK